MATKSPKSTKKEKQPAAALTYQKVKATCVCGAEYDTGSVLGELRVDICASCHPFFTGENRIVDTEGRIEKFRKKYNLDK